MNRGVMKAATLLSIAPLFSLAVPAFTYASPSVINGLVISLDSRGGSTISGTTWSAQDGTSQNATLQSSSQYDSSNQYVTMNDSTSPNYAALGNGSAIGDALNPSGDMTVEAWVKFNNIHTGTGWNIVATKWFQTSTGTAGCSSGTFHFGLKAGYPNIYITGSGGQNLSGPTLITSGTWHQLAFTVINPSDKNGSSSDVTGTLALYLDGALQISVNGSTVYQTPNTSCHFNLGDGRSTGSLGIDGGLEKFRMYNRALSASEINKNYRADANIHSLPAAPFNTVIPTISGPAKYAAVETGTSGTWLNSPTSYGYQWSRSPSSSGTYSAISGATSVTYTTTASDVGKFLKISVGATNSSGTIFETSTATAVIEKSGVNLSFTSANQFPVYRTINNLNVATSGIAGTVTFKVDGKLISGCRNLPSVSGNSYIAQCPWKPSVHKSVDLTATFTPTDSNYLSNVGSLYRIQVVARTNKR